MFVSIDLCLVPIGVGTSLTPYIKECIEVIKNKGLNYELGANGTAIEGDWDEVFECVRKCHEKIHSKGAPRIYTTMKVNTRTESTLNKKSFSSFQFSNCPLNLNS